MTIKQIDTALEESESLKAIAQAYSEIANLKVKRIRISVERNRIFFQEISKVYQIVRKIAVQRKINVQKPKQTVSIVLTSNRGFYGSINSDLLKFFIDYTSKIETDRIIVNKAGIEYFRSQPLLRGYSEVMFKGDEPNAEELMLLANSVKDYNRVLVFFSSMKSLLKQVPAMADITASSTSHLEGTNQATASGSFGTLPGEGNKQQFKFIFEPELEKILQFFDNQVTTLLLEEALLESELSRTASRFISMDEAENASNKVIKQYLSLRAYTKRNMDNNTILENFATMMAVRRTE